MHNLRWSHQNYRLGISAATFAAIASDHLSLGAPFSETSVTRLNQLVLNWQHLLPMTTLFAVCYYVQISRNHVYVQSAQCLALAAVSGHKPLRPRPPFRPINSEQF
jgi:hypothetical protein